MADDTKDTAAELRALINHTGDLDACKIMARAADEIDRLCDENMLLRVALRCENTIKGKVDLFDFGSLIGF